MGNNIIFYSKPYLAFSFAHKIALFPDSKKFFDFLCKPIFLAKGIK
ncbi:MAG: hypothetical protein ACJAZX_000789 [Rickettsiales bacterium]|jgi:hypothetical protein